MLRRWHAKKRRLFWLGAGLALGAIVLAIAGYEFLRVPTLPLPAGVIERTAKVRLAGKVVAVDFYLPTETGSAPVVVVAHGFTRNRKTMAGWGGMLAKAGFIAVVPDLPTWPDHVRNGRALVELVDAVLAEKFFQRPKPSGRAALVGFSAGGLSTLLAAGGNPNVACWVGLDPVGRGSGDVGTARQLNIPSFVLRAEPAPWNANGNARQIFAALPGPVFSLVVNGANHVDAEFPTSRAAEWACGRSDPVRRELFGRYLLASLQLGLLKDEAALRQLGAATNDTGVHDVVFRNRETFPTKEKSTLP